VLEGGVAGAGGAKSTGAMIPLAAPLVGRLKKRSSICGEINGADADEAPFWPAGSPDTALVWAVEGAGAADAVVLV
jgi:hypothetical protein